MHPLDTAALDNLGVAALDGASLRDTSGGCGPWCIGILVGVAVAIADNVDALVEGIEAGFDAAT